MNKKIILIVGDIIVIALLTMIGFITHGELGLSYLPRMGASFVPVLIGWFLLAPWFGLFKDEIIKNKKMLWRIPLAMLFAAPLAVILRAALLHSPAQPLFALVLGGSNAFGLMVWRWLAGGIK